LLDQAIETALAQIYTNREVLIVDDGSSDHTNGVALKYGSAIRYLLQENKGKSAALNSGIAAAEGDVIIVLDDDDLFPRSALANHAEALPLALVWQVGFAAANWPPLMRMAFASQIRWRVRAAMLQGQVHYALALGRLLRGSFGMATTLAVLGSRYDAGTKQWKVNHKVRIDLARA
jgi:glycosyltransferase involved in cell wall biosynthesis